MTNIKLVIPKEIDDKYNHALSELPMGKNTLIGNKDKLAMLESAMYDYEIPNAILVGPQGIGKTALVEQMVYNRSLTNYPILIVQLAVEVLGELADNVMVSRMKSLLSDMKKINKATAEYNNSNKFQMALFVDEVHKLYGYGLTGNVSGAMNALKESTARAEFPLISATTDYEFRENISKDLAFVRRFHDIVLQEPSDEVTKKILKRRVDFFKRNQRYVPHIDEKMFDEIVYFARANITEQVNPAKSLAILSSAIAICTKKKLQNEYGENEDRSLNHQVIKEVFNSKGYSIDILTDSKKVVEEMKGIKGQPLAIKSMMDAVNSAIYTTRDYSNVFMTAFFVGTTGTGKTETAKALARAFFGSVDALISLNGGDFSAEDDAEKAQHFIGDSMINEKRRVILLDEIEKSHENVLFSYMRMLDEGVVRDSNNIERSVRSSIIIATSNLGAKIFSDLEQIMKLNQIDLPDMPPLYDFVEENKSKSAFEELKYQWKINESGLRKALQEGDVGRNNGIKPEFLERFKFFIPFLPLTRKTQALIARKKLEKFKLEMMEQKNILIQIPKTKTQSEWEKLISNSHYDGVDGISVMIAEDILNQEASTTGARAIDRFVELNIKPKVAQMIKYRQDNNLDFNGAIRLKTNGKAIFEGDKRGEADVKVEYIGKGEL